MAFRFEWNRMSKTPEGELARRQLADRQAANSLESAAESYADQAEKLLAGSDGIAAKNELPRFAGNILTAKPTEQEEELEKLVHALTLRKRSIFGDIPDEKYDQLAFALALVKAYEKSLH